MGRQRGFGRRPAFMKNLPQAGSSVGEPPLFPGEISQLI